MRGRGAHRPGTKAVFARDLRASVPGLTPIRLRDGRRALTLIAASSLEQQWDGPLTTPDHDMTELPAGVADGEIPLNHGGGQGGSGVPSIVVSSRANRLLAPGDPHFLNVARRAYRAGHLTHDEYRLRVALHGFIRSCASPERLAPGNQLAVSTRPTATELLAAHGGLLTRSVLRELGLEPRSIDPVFRALWTIVLLSDDDRPRHRSVVTRDLAGQLDVDGNVTEIAIAAPTRLRERPAAHRARGRRAARRLDGGAAALDARGPASPAVKLPSGAVRYRARADRRLARRATRWRVTHPRSVTYPGRHPPRAKYPSSRHLTPLRPVAAPTEEEPHAR